MEDNRLEEMKVLMKGSINNIFVNHVKSHLKDGEEVQCKICNKFIDEIFEEVCQKVIDKLDEIILNNKKEE